jgi:hypothetical protein
LNHKEILYRNDNPGSIREDDESGSFFFNTGHHYEVWKARKDRGLPVYEPEPLPDYYMVGKKVICIDEGRECVVESAMKYWYAGYYISLFLVDKNRSHRVVYWESIGCYHPIILEGIEEANEYVKVIE